MPTPTRLIRNFSIIAHIDHGKSTLADRLLDATGALTQREQKSQFLDSMDLERERGITIKAATVRLTYKARDGQTYELNLIDTPGHVDFHYEVSRSLAACEGALLVVDASQGVEAQTLANVYLASEQQPGDRPGDQQDRPARRRSRGGAPADRGGHRHRRLGRHPGLGQDRARGSRRSWSAVVERVPPPTGDADKPLKVLLLDSWYDSLPGRGLPGAGGRRRAAARSRRSA